MSLSLIKAIKVIMNLKSIGYSNEKLVADYFKNQGGEILHQNWTIRGGEVDLIMKQNNDLVFIEVKTVDHTDSIHGYITQGKIRALQRSIDTYIQTYEPDYDNIKLIFMFVKNKKIIEIFEYEG